MKGEMCLISIVVTLIFTSSVATGIDGSVKVNLEVMLERGQSYTDISPEVAWQWITNCDVIILDVRSQDRYVEGYINNALSVPFLECPNCFLSQLDEFKFDKIIIYCDNGDISELACDYLSGNGFSEIYLLKGGIDAWRSKGFPIIASSLVDSCGCGILEDGIHFTGLLSGGPEIPRGIRLIGGTPPSWDWRDATYNGVTGDWTTSIKDQGNCGSCYAFGSLAGLESIIKIKSMDPDLLVDLSEQFMVSCGQEWMSGIMGCQGAYFQPTFDFIETYGAIPETCFPYVSGSSGYEPPCSDKCSQWEDLIIEIDDWHTVSSDIESIKNALIQYGPLPTAMVVYGDFHDYSGGIYEHPGSEPDPTNHIVTIVGYDDSQNYWICKNSWGTNWGENGWFRIAYGDCKIEQETVYFEYTDQISPLVKVRIHRIQMIGPIETFLEFGADWSYRIEVFDGNDWISEVNNGYSSNDDDHTEDVTHRFTISTIKPEVTIKVWDRDILSGDDLADVSGYHGGGEDNDITDKRGAIFHCKYDIMKDELIEIDTVVVDGGYYTTSGTYLPDGGDNSDAENDAKVWFAISDNYEPPEPDLEVAGSFNGRVKSGKEHYHLGSFTVENMGIDPYGIGESYLDWEVAETPNWGSNWRFEPNGETGLPSCDSTIVDVYVDVPDEIGTFSGEIRVWNVENHNDDGKIPIQLETAVRQRIRRIQSFELFLIKMFNLV